MKKRLLPLVLFVGCGTREPPVPTVHSAAVEVRSLEQQIRRDSMRLSQLRRMHAKPAILRRWDAIIRDEKERYREAKERLLRLEIEEREAIR